MARKPPSANGIRGGSYRAHYPGAYAQVLDEVCSEQAADPDAYLQASGDPLDLIEYEEAEAERKAALLRERAGRPVSCRSYQLPRVGSSPFERFPRDGQRSFLVFPNDEIVLQPRQSKGVRHDNSAG